jgi:sugar lactone lactonase YvrE
VDTAGNVYIADSGHGDVVKVASAGGGQAALTVNGTLTTPTGVGLDAAGNVYLSDPPNNSVVEAPAPDTAQQAIGTSLDQPRGVAVYAPAPTFSADSAPTTADLGSGYSYDFEATALPGEPAPTFSVASGALPPGLILDPTTGALSGTPTATGTFTFVIETENLANGTLGPSTSIVVTRGNMPTAPIAGTLFVTDFNYRVVEIPPAGTGGAQADYGVGLSVPAGVAVDSKGNVYIVDEQAGKIFVDTPGVALQNSVNTNFVPGGLVDPTAVAVDSKGDVFIANTGNNDVVEVPPSGSPTAWGTGLNRPSGVAVDSQGDVFIADTDNQRVVEVSPSHVQKTVYSGADSYPTGVAVDGKGDLYIADLGTNLVVEVTTTPNAPLVSWGTGLIRPDNVAVDGAGNVYIADENGVLEETPGGVQTEVGTGLMNPVGVAVYVPAGGN